MIYLGKFGKIFGPYSEAQLAKIQKSGEISQYTYICEAREGRPGKWQLLDPHPPVWEEQKLNSENDFILFSNSQSDAVTVEEISRLGAKLKVADSKNQIFNYKKGQKIQVSSVEGKILKNRFGVITGVEHGMIHCQWI